MNGRWQVGVVMMVLAVVGFALWLSTTQSEPSATLPVAEPSQTSPVVTKPSQTPTPSVSSATPTKRPGKLVRAAEPVVLVIPGLLRAPFGGAIVPNADNQLVPPSSSEAFRWAERGRPGCPSTDTVFVLGHTVRAGRGVFDRLQDVHVGQRLTIRTETGVVRYVVERTKLYERSSAPQVETLYAAKPGRLQLIACFLNPDGSPQTHNFVATAQAMNC